MSEPNLKVSKAKEISKLNNLTVGSTAEPSSLKRSPKDLDCMKLIK